MKTRTFVKTLALASVLTAVAVGIVSGLAATGGYEAVHQFQKKEESE